MHCIQPEWFSGDVRGLVQFWNVQSGELEKEIEADGDDLVLSVAYSPDGARLVVECEIYGLVYVFDVETSEEILVVNPGDQRDVNAVAFSTDGSQIVFGCSDSEICVWDVKRRSDILEDCNVCSCAAF